MIVQVEGVERWPSTTVTIISKVSFAGESVIVLTDVDVVVGRTVHV